MGWHVDDDGDEDSSNETGLSSDNRLAIKSDLLDATHA